MLFSWSRAWSPVRGAGLVRLHRPSFKASLAHNFSQHSGYRQYDWSQSPVRILRPTIWSVSAVTVIYFTCAAYDVYRDVKGYDKETRSSITFDRLEADRSARRRRQPKNAPEFTAGSVDPLSPSSVWNSLSGPSQVMACVAATNAAVLALSKSPSVAAQEWVLLKLAHIPVDGAFRNHQLLTSTFVHTGPLHLLLNTFVLYNFGGLLARTPEFQNSGSHTLAFYLSAGIFSGLGSHVSSAFWPNQSHRFRAGMGFSGVVSAVFAAWCMEYPDARLQIFPIPSSFTGRDILEFSAAFETLGVLGVWKRLRVPIDVGFAAHLTGMVFGVVYVTFGKNERLFIPFRRAAFRTMKTMSLI